MEWNKTFSASEYWKMRQPAVYGWFRDNKCLYIGSTGRGFIHLYNHPVVGKLDDILQNDQIRFIWMETLAEARRLERELIVQYEPFYNVANSTVNRVLTQKRIRDYFENEHEK